MRRVRKQNGAGVFSVDGAARLSSYYFYARVCVSEIVTIPLVVSILRLRSCGFVSSITGTRALVSSDLFLVL